MVDQLAKKEIRNVQVHRIDNLDSEELSDVFFRNCTFCEKIVKVIPNNVQSCCQLGGKQFYCPFCLRHNHHHRSGQNILILSYRAVIAYYYHKYYLGDSTNNNRHYCKNMYWSEIQAIIELHKSLGLSNPVFNYDPLTYLWFIDFNRIGNQKRKAPYKEVEATARLMLDAFQMPKIVSHYADQEFWAKIEKAMSLFYKQRKRPKDRKMLIPTLIGQAHGVSEEFLESTRDFTAADLRLV